MRRCCSLHFIQEIEDKVICAAAGGMHNVYITEKGEVFTFGCNDEGALGRKTEEEEDCMVTERLAIIGKTHPTLFGINKY